MKLNDFVRRIIRGLLIGFAVFVLWLTGDIPGWAMGISTILLMIAALILSSIGILSKGDPADGLEDGEFVIENISWESKDDSGEIEPMENISLVVAMWSRGGENKWGKLKIYRIYNFKNPGSFAILSNAHKGDLVEVKGGGIGYYRSAIDLKT